MNTPAEDDFADTQPMGLDGPKSPVEALTSRFVLAAPSQVARTGVAAANDDVPAQVRQGFRVGELRLMIRYEDGSELTDMPALRRLPHAPAWMPGIANLHGSLVPVFDLGELLGVAKDEAAKPMLLVLAHGADAAGVVIDGLPQRLRFHDGDSAGTTTAPQRLQPHLRGAALVGGELWFDLDCAGLLAHLEHSLES